MFATSLTAAVLGVEAHLVRVEADTAPGFPRFAMVGLPDCAVKESEARIRAALRNCGLELKWDRRITVNLAPAGLRKYGSSYDLATAFGLLAADGLLPHPRLSRVLVVGELALDGAVRPVPGVLPMLLLARRHSLDAAIVPAANHAEAALLPDFPVHPAASLHDALALARSDTLPAPPPFAKPAPDTPAEEDLVDVRGQLLARRALEIAAAGGHNLLYSGPPGAGKTMLARRLAGLLPPLTLEEALEVAAVHSAAGLMPDAAIARRPFRAPHHTASEAALVGGGARPRPGEVSLAHHGVLFLDELPEFRRSTLEVLRQPLEDGHVIVARHRGSILLPARFQLVAAMNPCPCGLTGSALACRCSPAMVRTYLGRLSGPLLDRFDLHASVPPVSFDEIAGPPGASTAAVRERVLEARRVQARRAPAVGANCNARIPSGVLRRIAAPDAPGESLLRRAVGSAGLTARGLDRLLRVARTIADLAGRSSVGEAEVAEALQFRACVADTAGRYSLQGFGEYS